MAVKISCAWRAGSLRCMCGGHGRALCWGVHMQRMHERMTRARNAGTDLRGRGSHGGAGARFMVGGKSPMRVPRAGFTPVAVCGRAGARRCGRARRRGRRGRARRRTRCKRRARAVRADTGTRGRGRIGSRCGVWRLACMSDYILVFRGFGVSRLRGFSVSVLAQFL